MRRVLVTGASGLVGRNTLAPLRARGFEVHAASRRSPADVPDGVAWHEADLLVPGAAAALAQQVGATHLLHLAWCTEHGRFWELEENLDWVATSLLLLRSFYESGGRRAVIAGTCAEYDWHGDCCGEGTPLRPGTLYGTAKHALRELAEAYARTSGLGVAWGRIFFLFGPGEQESRVVSAAARALAAGEPFACSTGSQVRDFLHAADVASAFVALVDAEATGAFDIGSGEPLALGDLLLRLGNAAGRPDLLRFGDAPSREEPARIVADPRRLREELGWQPEVPLDRALADMLDWWRSARRVRPTDGQPGQSP